MADDVVYLTQEGLDKLKADLKTLIDVKRVEVAKRIKTARDMGDTSENAEYIAAREEQAFVEGKIIELQEILKKAKVGGHLKDTISVGSTVVVHIDGVEELFHIVGAPEADPLNKKISHESPLGAALLGKTVGNKIEVDAPVGKLTYTILRIE